MIKSRVRSAPIPATQPSPAPPPPNLRDMLLGALEAKGGQAYLEQIATDHPKVFCGLLGRILPTVLAPPDDPTASGKLEISWIMSTLNGTGRDLPSDRADADRVPPDDAP